MAFEGDLSNLSLGDVLQTIAMGRQVGTFVIRGTEERRLACGPHGVALLSSRSSLGLKIGAVLVGTGKASPEQVDQALKIQRRRRDILVGQLLIENGACSEEDVRGACRYIAAEEIYELFFLSEGKFEFLDGSPELTGPFTAIWFDVGSLAMEAARRIDELPRAQEKVPAGEVFVRVEGTNPRQPDVDKSRDLSTLCGLADGTRSVVDIQECYYRGVFDTWKGMEQLVEWGLLRPATFQEVMDAAHAATTARHHARASRLFARAAQHEPGDDSIRQRVADSLRDAGEKRLASEQLVALGRARLEAGKGLPAVETFRQALLLDGNNADAQEGLMHALAESGRVEEAVEAAHAAACLRLSGGDFTGAGRCAEAGLAQSPGDPHLLVSLANANYGLGRSAEAVKLLDDAAQILETASGDDRKLLEVYRRILQIDSERKDCQRRIDEIHAFERTKRRRRMQRIAIGAGALILAAAAVPFLRGPSAEAKIDKIRALVDADQAAEAQTLIAELADRSLSANETIDLNGLKARIDQVLHPPESATVRIKIDGELDLVYRAESLAIQADRPAEGLKTLLDGLDILNGPDARKLKSLDAPAYEKLKAEAAKEVHLAIGAAATASQRAVQRITGMRDRFDENVWKREDIDVLHDLVKQSALAIDATKANNWAVVPDIVQKLVARTQALKDGADKKTIDAVANIAEAYQQVCDFHDRALARARRKELKEAYLAAYSGGAQLERDGRIEEALQRYDAFLAQCEQLRTAVPDKLYGPIKRELFGGEMLLDQRVRTSRERVASVARDCEDARQAEAADDLDRAFRIRKRLVHEAPDIDFSRRFQMPLRIETAPPGAEVFILDGSPGGRSLGTTPVGTQYPIEDGAKFEIRLDGYKSREIVRKGATDDSTCLERIELAKLAVWTSSPTGISESPASAAPGSILVAERSGLILRFDSKTGAEIARFQSGLLDGFAGSAAVKGDRVFATALDGKGFVLSLERLEKLAAFETGPSHSTPLAASCGVVVVDDSGLVRLIDDDGHVVWKTQIGKTKRDPVLVGDRALLVTADAEAVLVNVATGEVVRRRQLPNNSEWGHPTVRGGRAFVANDAGEVACLDVATLADLWTQRVQGSIRGRICATDLRAVVCTVSGAVTVLDAETGNPLATTQVGGKIYSGACDLPDGDFVVVTRKGVVTRFDPRCMTVWRYEAGDDVSAPPRLIDGSVVVVTRKGVVISLAR